MAGSFWNFPVKCSIKMIVTRQTGYWMVGVVGIGAIKDFARFVHPAILRRDTRS